MFCIGRLRFAVYAPCDDSFASHHRPRYRTSCRTALKQGQGAYTDILRPACCYKTNLFEEIKLNIPYPSTRLHIALPCPEIPKIMTDDCYWHIYPCRPIFRSANCEVISFTFKWCFCYVEQTLCHRISALPRTRSSSYGSALHSSSAAFFLRCIPVRQIFFNGAGRLPLHEKPVDEPHRFPWYIGFPPVFFMHFFVMCFSRQVFCRSKFPVYA